MAACVMTFTDARPIDRGHGYVSVAASISRYDCDDEVEPDRAHALTLLLGELVMMPEQVQPRLHRREHLVDRRLAGVDSARARPAADEERPRRLVRQEHVDAARAPCRPRTSSRTKCRRLSRLLGRAAACPCLGCGSRAAGVSYQRRRERAAEAATRHAADLRAAAPFCEVVQRWPAAAPLGDDVEVLVVALDPVERRGERFVVARRRRRHRRRRARTARRDAAP